MISFNDLQPHEKQAFADFQLKEKYRHLSDVKNIEADLKHIELIYGIKPTEIYCDWIEVKE